MANAGIFARDFAFATRILAVAAGADELQLRGHGHDPVQDAKLRRGDRAELAQLHKWRDGLAAREAEAHKGFESYTGKVRLSKQSTIISARAQTHDQLREPAPAATGPSTTNCGRRPTPG